MEAGATGDIAVCLQRRQGSIAIPIWLWLGGAWVDVASLTATQWSTYVTDRLAAIDNPNATRYNPDGTTYLPKVDGLTISKTQF